MTSAEDLDELIKYINVDLREFLVYREPYGFIINSPFVIETNLNLLTIEKANKDNEHKRALIKAQTDIQAFLTLFTPNFAIWGYKMFLEANPKGMIQGDIIRQIWMNQTEVYTCYQFWNELLRDLAPGVDTISIKSLEKIMTPEEITYHRNNYFPKVYRGQETVTSGMTGLSWTPIKKIAEDYAAKCNNGTVVEKDIRAWHETSAVLFREEGIEIIILDPKYDGVYPPKQAKRNPILMMQPQILDRVPSRQKTAAESESISRPRVQNEQGTTISQTEAIKDLIREKILADLAKPPANPQIGPDWLRARLDETL